MAGAAVCATLALIGKTMSQALDDLTASVGRLETTAAVAVTEIGSLKAGSDDAALTDLKARVDTVAANLTAAVTPPAA